MEKARPPSFVLVLTVIADLVVDDLSRLLEGSDSVKVARLLAECWTAMVKDFIH